MWKAWQPGVKAPGTETRTIFLLANSLEASNSCGTPQAVGSASVMGAHLLTIDVSSLAWVEDGGYDVFVVCLLELNVRREAVADLEGSHDCWWLVIWVRLVDLRVDGI